MEKVTCKVIKHSLLNSNLVGVFLIGLYFMVYGFTAQAVLSGLELLFFFCSMLFALSIFCTRDPVVKQTNAKKGILVNQVVGTGLVFAYLLVFGVSSIAILNGFQLVFFMSSYIFVMSIFYIRDPERIEKEEGIVSYSASSPFAERNPCFINSQDLSWLIRELNGPLSTVIGFSELILRREYSEHEKEYMLRNIYESALNMSGSIGKVSAVIQDSPTKPRMIHEVVDLLSDKNFI